MGRSWPRWRRLDYRRKRSVAHTILCATKKPSYCGPCLVGALARTSRQGHLEMDVRLAAEISHLACLDRLESASYGPLLTLVCGLEVFSRTLELMELEH